MPGGTTCTLQGGAAVTGPGRGTGEEAACITQHSPQTQSPSNAGHDSVAGKTGVEEPHRKG